MKPRDVLDGTTVGGIIIGLALMAVGVLSFIAAADNAGFLNSNNWDIDLVEGAVFFALGGAFLLVSGFLIPALRAIERERSRQP